MDRLRLYRALSRGNHLSYRAKIMVTAFIGTHVPLIALIAFFAIWRAPTWTDALVTIGVALVATLAGTGATLFVLNQLLQPILMTAKALRAYVSDRTLPSLPLSYADDAGRLMADASTAMLRLDTMLDRLEHGDAATGLRNRAGLLRSLRPLLDRREAPLALAVIRLRDHDRLLGAFGQEAVDASMAVLAGRLADAAQPGTLLARVDGGVLALVLESCTGPEQVSAELDSLRAQASRKMQRGDLNFMPDLTAAAALYPFDGQDAEALLDAATLALGEADRLGSRRVAFFSPASRDAAQERFVMEQDLRAAVEQDELSLHYQPVVAPQDGKVVGAEALLRWNHPVLGMVPPSSFIPIAEQSGQMPSLGLWVLREACAEAGRWRAEGLNDMTVAVNLSARQFAERDIINTIGDMISGAGVAPGTLGIELTETAAMSDVERSRRVFGALREMGVSIAIDDFGTGYSSMSYLKNLPFDTLKIDREFVRDVHLRRDSAAICHALIELARGLDLDVLAEGTENADEVRALMAQGCGLFQGFYFARPMPGAEFRHAVTGTDWAAIGASLKPAAERKPHRRRHG